MDLFINSFRQRMREHPLWTHPFFDLLKHPSRDALQQWTIHGGQIEEAFPRILQLMFDNANIVDDAHDVIAEQLNDELGHANSELAHFEIYKRLLEAMDISYARYRSTPLTDGTNLLIRTLCEGAVDSNPLRSLSLMASEESIIQIEFPKIIDSINQEFDLRGHLYFTVHIAVDVHHTNQLLELCYKNAHTKNDIANIFEWQQMDLDNNVRFYNSLMEVIETNKTTQVLVPHSSSHSVTT
jgi:pyrroloquinoline quinone (PQQ) biosynthesis protein C